jgi:hypothetical protein
VKRLAERLLDDTQCLLEKKEEDKKEVEDLFPGLNHEEEVTFSKSRSPKFKSVMDQIYKKIDNRPRMKQIQLQRHLLNDLLDAVLGKTVNDKVLLDRSRKFLRTRFTAPAKGKKNAKE